MSVMKYSGVYESKNACAFKNDGKGNFIFMGPAQVYIKEVIYNKPATIVLWSDKTKTICKCSENDTYNMETGLLVCIYKKLHGSKDLKQLLSDWAPDNEGMISQRVTLRDVMQKNK